jgi:hypothetical protein
MHWKIILILIAGSCFLISSAAHIIVKFALRPKPDSDWQEVHWEFEDHDPALQRYQFWSRITFGAVIVSMLLLFILISV